MKVSQKLSQKIRLSTRRQLGLLRAFVFSALASRAGQWGNTSAFRRSEFFGEPVRTDGQCAGRGPCTGAQDSGEKSLFQRRSSDSNDHAMLSLPLQTSWGRLSQAFTAPPHKHATTFYITAPPSSKEGQHSRGPTPRTSNPLHCPQFSPRNGLFHCNMLYVASSAFF